MNSNSEKILKLVSQGKLDVAISEMIIQTDGRDQAAHQETIVVSADYQIVESASRSGRISFAEEKDQKNSIAHRIIKISEKFWGR